MSDLRNATGTLTAISVGQLVILNARHFNVDVDTIEPCAGDMGPKERDSCYLVTMPGEQMQGLAGSPK